MQYHHRDGSNPSHPAGDSRKLPLRVDFDRRLKLEFLGSKITSDAGLLAYRELDDILGLTDLAGAALSDLRRGKNTRHLLTGLLRQSVFGRLAGYEDVNDAERLSRDPAMRAIVDRKGLDRRAASTSQMGRFETEWLATDDNLAGLTALSGFWIDRVHDRRPPKMIALDMDSSVSPTHGEQEGTADNGHFGCACYHPLFVFNQFGDLERCALRPGNVHSADGWREVLEPVVSRYRDRKLRRYFRADAAFASPEVYEFLEAEGFLYAIRLPANRVLQQSIAHLLRRPVGRPPKEVRRYHASFSYKAQSWSKSRRVVAKVEGHPGELFPRSRMQKPLPLFQQLTRDHPARGDDVCPLPVVAETGRRSAGRARHRCLPRDGEVLVEPLWPAVRRRDQAAAGSPAQLVELAVAP